uniref:C-type lectin domain-containing protein n=1 Tax=Ciona savignyi TaxID=51511 RepID=H2YA41_CIOSA
CKVEVVQNEPMYQKVGRFTPETFDCDYLPNSVRYEHNGSPFLLQDDVKLRSYVMLSNATVQETVIIHIRILNSRCDIIQINDVPLRVERNTKFSNPINRDVMEFDYDRDFDTECEVRVIYEGLYEFPAQGQLVRSDNSTETANTEQPHYITTGTIRTSCDDFLVMGIRYEHRSVPTPDVDYIPIHVVVTDRRSGSVLTQERHFLPVTIASAFPNQPPKPSFTNMYILEVDQFVLTNILPMTVSAMDGETRNERLIFNISKQPEAGFITHLNDESKSIDSFWQEDLESLQIAYQPPNISYPERQSFVVEFTIFDAYFEHSMPIRALFSVRVAQTNAPRVSWNMGLSMLEGQSRPITHSSLQVVDKDNLNRVRFMLAGGLQHGRLYVNNRPGFTFQWRDIEKGVVTYQHDDTDTRKDKIVFRVTDGIHSTRFKMPIKILPKDDAPPFLINNIVFTVHEGQTILIHRFMLEAHDADSSADYIKFNITKLPVAGEVQKRRNWERAGWAVNKFQQSDLYKGLIYYKHLGNEVFDDSFEFTLIDSCTPVPNISPIHRVVIKITPVNDLPPQPADGNSLALTLNETDVIHLTRRELHYVDLEEANSDVTFNIDAECRVIGGQSGVNAGRLIFTDDMVMLMKDPSVPTLRTFTQSAVDHEKVAYMPPMEDVGLHPLDVQFTFSVADGQGREIRDLTFAITVLPVDNQVAPTINVTRLSLHEGATQVISADLMQIHDEDTRKADLVVYLSTPPLVGAIYKNDIEMRENDSFSVMDVEFFRIIYHHDGGEIHTDRFQLTVSDGKQNTSTWMHVKITPVDDMPPTINGKIVMTINVREGSWGAISSDHLTATDVDTNDNELIFEILVPPHLGEITINGEPVTSFQQQDILDGKVHYEHDGTEVGKYVVEDVATFMVVDRRGNIHAVKDGFYEWIIAGVCQDTVVTTKDVHFDIHPVNTHPPRVALGSQVFRCNEGGFEPLTEAFLMADDFDSPTLNLSFIITEEPTYGFIEDVTPRPGYEKVIGKRTNSFTYDQLMSGYIRYVQSQHQGMEPTSDQFSIRASDGDHLSAQVPFLISITPMNDEAPVLIVQNITCNEGEMAPLTLVVDDMDSPHDHVMVVVTEAPTHGMVMDEMDMLSRYRRSGSHRSVHMHAMEEFSMQQLNEHRVIPAYFHDGSESVQDQLELKVTDGMHVYKTHLMVNIIQVNDETPEIVHNEGITLELGSDKVISSVALQARDGDTISSELLYELHSIPRRGLLQIKQQSDIVWNDLELGETFTEKDVEMNRIRYHHSSVLGSKGQDSFRFSVTDGEFTTPRVNFAITIEHTKKSAIHVTTHPLRVNERGQGYISGDVLLARDDAQRPEEITFDVIRSPAYGRIEYINFPGMEIEMFTQLDIMARNVIYIHTSKADTAVDTFRILASNGIKTKEAEINILITSVDEELPVLTLPQPSSMGHANLMLYSGSSVTITNMIINITDEDTSKNNVRLIIMERPQHGSMRLDGVETTVVTLGDLERGGFAYHHNGDGASIDRFTFTVSDGVHAGYFYQGGIRRQEATAFNLKIESLDETPPYVALNIEPTMIQPLGNHQTNGIYIDSNFLRTQDSGTLNNEDLIISIITPPSYGQLRLVHGNIGEESVMQFSQSDLDHRNIIYVVAARMRVDNDSFTFSVQDAWSNTLSESRFSMSWSHIKISQRKIKVCEDVGFIEVQVSRSGNLTRSAFVGVMVQPRNAKPGVDYVPSSATQIQFDPGVAHQTWRIEIMNDQLEERSEKFLVKLHTPVNSVLNPKKQKMLVVIKDKSHPSCSGGSLAKQSKKLNSKKLKSKKRKNKTKKKKSKAKKRKKGQSRNIAADQSSTSSGRGGQLLTQIRYGKHGPGVTVSPASFFRNETHRIWRYHGLLPVTVDETEEDIFSSSSNVLDVVPTAQKRKLKIIDRLEVNDDPTASRVSLVTTISQPCNLSARGRLHYDAGRSTLFQCDGSQWLAWRARERPVIQPEPTTPANHCEDGWCYYVSSAEEISWNSAQRSCREIHGAHLVSLGSRKQMNWLWKLSRKTPFFIGLNSKLNHQEWEWMDGSEVSFMNWKRRFPRPDGGRCVVVVRRQWQDHSCSDLPTRQTKYICARDP